MCCNRHMTHRSSRLDTAVRGDSDMVQRGTLEMDLGRSKLRSQPLQAVERRHQPGCANIRSGHQTSAVEDDSERTQAFRRRIAVKKSARNRWRKNRTCNLTAPIAQHQCLVEEGLEEGREEDLEEALWWLPRSAMLVPSKIHDRMTVAVFGNKHGVHRNGSAAVGMCGGVSMVDDSAFPDSHLDLDSTQSSSDLSSAAAKCFVHPLTVSVSITGARCPGGYLSASLHFQDRQDNTESPTRITRWEIAQERF
ncbi:hypothetical protein C8R44DRAFT_740729 [Mycena epipterygia]|nr:hypothetical protein C8R44DRAFT_740729 [Mycena epipterygia]